MFHKLVVNEEKRKFGNLLSRERYVCDKRTLFFESYVRMIHIWDMRAHCVMRITGDDDPTSPHRSPFSPDKQIFVKI